MKGRPFILRYLLRLTSLSILLGGIGLPAGIAQNSLPATESLQVIPFDTIQLQHKYLAPQTFRIIHKNKPLSPQQYHLNLFKGTFALLDSSLSMQPLSASYRYFPRFLQEYYALRYEEKRKDTTSAITTFIERYSSPEKDFWQNSPTLRKSGSISRGITVGNNQNLSVQSGLRLQVEGDLGDDISILAAITDENIPIQPDGTTQQIQDFDKVFIQLKKGNHDIVLGDFEINHKQTHFANFYRNVQGLGVNIRHNNLHISANGTVAKGKFNTNSFQGQENVQGPYRLTGRNNERFIVILAGSEKVYLNGELMQRGEANDYVMDYNSGELSFTQNRVISTATRIVVDFEYTDRFYNRSLQFFTASDKLIDERLQVGFSYGRDADNQNAPVGGEFSDLEKQSLRDAGDATAQAFVSGVDTADLNEDFKKVRYYRSDTLINSITYPRFIYSTDSSAILLISFTFVGAGNGFYTKNELAGVNGQVFSWVPPDAQGKPTGEYAPIKQLALPRSIQVADLKASFQLTKKIKTYTEVALSSEDKNRFSSIGDQDNVDFANRTGVQFQKLKLADSLQLDIDLSQQYVGNRYTNIDRIYKVEYGREWNYDDLNTRATERITEGKLALNWKDKVNLSANAGLRSFGANLNSIKQNYQFDSKHKLLQGTYKIADINTENTATGLQSRWLRHNGNLFKQIRSWKPGIEIWIEDKEDQRFDSLQSGTFRFYDLKPYLQYGKSDTFRVSLYYNFRKEHEFLDSTYRDKSIAHTEYLQVQYQPVNGFKILNTASLRNFTLLDTAFESQGLSNSQSLMNNLQTTFDLGIRKKGDRQKIVLSNQPRESFLSTSLFYEAASEQLARKEVRYIRTNDGQGNYEWNDLDSNGQESINEFFESTDPSRRNYLRVIVPTQNLFPTTRLSLGANARLDFKRVVNRSRKFSKELLRNFVAITNWRVAQKKAAGTQLDNYLIDIGNIFNDTSLLEALYTFKQDVYFFQNHPTGELKFSYADSRSKLFLTTGDELRERKTYGSRQRLNIGNDKSIENEIKTGFKRVNVENFDDRNFDISFWEVNPKINFLFTRRLGLTVGYVFKDKRNFTDREVDPDIQLQMHRLQTDFKLNLKGRNNFFTKVEWVYIHQEGSGGFAAEYELRETLQAGNNLLWQTLATYYLSKSLELSLSYEGRAAADRKTVHTGRVQLRAFF